MEDALAAIQHSQFIAAHEFVTKFLIVGAIAGAVSARIGSIKPINCFLAECFGQFFQGGRFAAAKENLRIHVADNRIGIIFVDGFQLAAGLQNQASRNLAAADGGYQLFQLWNLPDVGTFVNQAPHMDRQLAAVHIISFVA